MHLLIGHVDDYVLLYRVFPFFIEVDSRASHLFFWWTVACTDVLYYDGNDGMTTVGQELFQLPCVLKFI